METRAKFERRRSKGRSYRLDQPAFLQIPRVVAAPAIIAITILAVFVGQYVTPEIWYGPIYLLICAFAAWLVGNRFAFLLGLLLVSIQVVSGRGILFHDLQMAAALNSALQLCSALAVVLMLGVAREALEIEWRFARLDPLTGALNRKAFFEAVGGNKGQGGMAVLVFADADGLKRLNDRLGHEAGDEALCDFANRVRKSIRKDDLFARIGGDEFVILLKVRDGAAARVVAERLNQTLNLELEDDRHKLKCSLGILVLPSGSKSIDAELKQADTLMYHAKKEQAGSVMAMSVKGDLRALMPFASATIATGEQRSAVQGTERGPDSSTSDMHSQASFAA